MTYKKTFKERFESTTLYTALAVPVAGVLGGAWFGATSGFATGTAGAVLLGTGGAAAGLVLGGIVGAAGFFTANAIYKNKEYIALAAIAVTVLPFALAGRALKAAGTSLSTKVQKIWPKRSSAASSQPPAVSEKPQDTAPTGRTLTSRLKACFSRHNGRKALPESEAANKADGNNASPVKTGNAPRL
jgi:hypothetical protein